MTTATTSASVLGDLSALVPSFERSLRAANKSAKTIKAYTEAANQLAAFLRERGMPTQVSKIRREHVETYIDDQLAKWKPATANNRYRSLAQYFAYLEEEGEIRTSPMAKMKPPKVPEQEVPVLSDDELRALLKACEGKGFEEKRDTAIIRLFTDTGMRCSELANLKVDELDLDLAAAVVLGKGRRPRTAPYGPKTAQAIDRYLRLRARHPYARWRKPDGTWRWRGDDEIGPPEAEPTPACGKCGSADLFQGVSGMTECRRCNSPLLESQISWKVGDEVVEAPRRRRRGGMRMVSPEVLERHTIR